jgi:hypothetical protein
MQRIHLHSVVGRRLPRLQAQLLRLLRRSGGCSVRIPPDLIQLPVELVCLGTRRRPERLKLLLRLQYSNGVVCSDFRPPTG